MVAPPEVPASRGHLLWNYATNFTPGIGRTRCVLWLTRLKQLQTACGELPTLRGPLIVVMGNRPQTPPNVRDEDIVSEDPGLIDNGLTIRADMPIRLEYRVTDAEGNSIALEFKPSGGSARRPRGSRPGSKASLPRVREVPGEVDGD